MNGAMRRSVKWNLLALWGLTKAEGDFLPLELKWRTFCNEKAGNEKLNETRCDDLTLSVSIKNIYFSVVFFGFFFVFLHDTKLSSVSLSLLVFAEQTLTARRVFSLT